jgi:hypothetical protein
MELEHEKLRKKKSEEVPNQDKIKVRKMSKAHEKTPVMILQEIAAKKVR